MRNFANPPRREREGGGTYYGEGEALRGHEGITAAGIPSEVLRWITIHELTAKHGMGHAADFMFDGKQLTACLGVDNVLEAILIGIAFLGNQTMLLQERVRT